MQQVRIAETIGHFFITTMLVTLVVQRIDTACNNDSVQPPAPAPKRMVTSIRQFLHGYIGHRSVHPGRWSQRRCAAASSTL